MNYSNTEIELFLKGLEFYLIMTNEDNSAVHNIPLSYEDALERIKNENPVFTSIDVDGINFPVKAVVLIKIFQHKRLWKELINEMIAKDFLDIFTNISQLIHTIPFNQLPLYINNYPDIVSWRLRIGK